MIIRNNEVVCTYALVVSPCFQLAVVGVSVVCVAANVRKCSGHFVCFICVDIGCVVTCACRDPKFMQDLVSQDSMQSVSYGRGEGGM